MLVYVLKRVSMTIPMALIISIFSFVIIQLPPGDYLTTYVAQLEAMGTVSSQAEIAALRARYGLDKPFYYRYFKWMRGILKGDFGYSFEWEQPVANLLGDRILLTFAISFASMMFTWVLAFPIGVYTALNQNSIGDYVASFLGFIGLAIPNFMLALVLMFISQECFGINVGGLFSVNYANAPWSWGKVVDLLSHLWVPVIIVGASGTAGMIRILRNNLLDELQKPYVRTARAKGVHPVKLIFKYPVRLALIPFASTIGWQLPNLISGSTIVSVVLSLPTTGPLLLRALLSQDMYLAGSFLLILAVLTVIGTLISDLILVLIDPRISYE